MKVILINPPVQRIIEKRYDRPDFPHLGLGYIASYLISKNIPCEVIDAKFERVELRGLLIKLKNIKPDLIGLTSMTHEIENVCHVAKSIKECLPDSKIVLGGVHVSFCPENTLKNCPSFDFAVIGEGEETFFELSKNLKNNENNFGIIQGLGFRINGKIKINSLRKKIENLDELPFPAWENWSRAEEYPIMTSRGCPFECIFCANPNGRVLRKRLAANVVSEFEWLVNRFNPQRIVFWDEGLTLDRERANTIFDLLINKGLHKRVKWYAQTHVSSVDYQIFKKMKEAGCISIGLGIESGNDKILSQLKKRTNLEDIKNAVRDAKKARLAIEGYFIFGHPYETKKTASDTIKFAIELNPEYPVFGIMVPYLGTEVFRMAQNGEGNYKLLSQKWSDYNKQLGNALELTDLNRHQLELFQLKGYLSVFIFNLRFVSLIKFIFKYRREVLIFFKKFLLRKNINPK